MDGAGPKYTGNYQEQKRGRVFRMQGASTAEHHRHVADAKHTRQFQEDAPATRTSQEVIGTGSYP